MNDTDFSCLEGTFIKEIWYHEDHDLLAFVTPEETFYYVCEGDCCSTSYVEHWDGIAAFMPKDGQLAKIIAVESISMDEVQAKINEEDKENEDTIYHDNCISVYGLKFITTFGQSTLEYRNQSNGYYGGWMCRLYGEEGWRKKQREEGDKPASRYGQDTSVPYVPLNFPADWKQITEDF